MRRRTSARSFLRHVVPLLMTSLRSVDNEFYEIRHEKSRIMHDKEALQVIYEDLLEQYNSLKDEHVRSPLHISSALLLFLDILLTLTSPQEQALASIAAADVRVAEAAKTEKNDRSEQAFKAEIDRLRADVQKTENQLGEAEQLVERQTKALEDLTRKVRRFSPFPSLPSRNGILTPRALPLTFSPRTTSVPSSLRWTTSRPERKKPSD